MGKLPVVPVPPPPLELHEVALLLACQEIVDTPFGDTYGGVAFTFTIIKLAGLLLKSSPPEPPPPGVVIVFTKT